VGGCSKWGFRSRLPETLMGSVVDPDPDPYPHQSDKVDPDPDTMRINLQMTGQNVWKMSLFGTLFDPLFGS
jgi:hypothetical protein